MMKPNFREDKAAQAAALLLKLRGGQMSHLKLMKLLYLAEREALLKWRRPIIYDSCVSMDYGPVLSQTLNVLSGCSQSEGLWGRTISSLSKNEVSLLNDPGADALSDAEEQLITEIFKRYGHESRWDLVEITHKLPEWQNPHGSSIPIDYRDILSGAGMTPGEIESILDEIEGIAMIELRLGNQSDV